MYIACGNQYTLSIKHPWPPYELMMSCSFIHIHVRINLLNSLSVASQHFQKPNCMPIAVDYNIKRWRLRLAIP